MYWFLVKWILIAPPAAFTGGIIIGLIGSFIVKLFL